MTSFAIADVTQLFAGLGLLIPGALIVYVRSLFLTGRRQRHGESLLSYVIITILYLALALPIFSTLYDPAGSGWLQYVLWVLMILIVPLCVGLLIGLAHQREWLRLPLDYLQLQVVHPMPTAWDRKFGLRKPHWLVVRLQDGSTVLGYYGANSFASSEPLERDLYIERVYLADDDGKWRETRNGIHLHFSRIRSIEFMEIDE